MNIALVMLLMVGATATTGSPLVKRQDQQQDDRSWFVEKMGYTIVEALNNYGCSFEPLGDVFQDRLTKASEKLAAEIQETNVPSDNFAAQFQFLGKLARKVSHSHVGVMPFPSFYCKRHL